MIKFLFKYKYFLLVVLFLIVIGGESYALYLRQYSLRVYFRTLFIPIAFFYGFRKDDNYAMNTWFYVTIILSWFGDILNLLTMYNIQYLAAAFYTFSCITLGYMFYKFKEKKYLVFNYIFFIFLILTIGAATCFFLFPHLYKTVIKTHLILHACVLIYAIIWAIQLLKTVKEAAIKYYIPALFCCIASHALYGYDVYMYHRELKTVEPVDVGVAILYAAYILLLAVGKKKVDSYIPVTSNVNVQGYY